MWVEKLFKTVHDYYPSVDASQSQRTKVATVPLEGNNSEDNDEWELFCSNSRVTLSISYEAGSKAVRYQQQRLDTAAADKRERRDSIIRSHGEAHGGE